MQRIVVIGAGLAGITTAFELVQRGYEVVVLEAREGVARGASFANGGLLTPSMADPWNSPGVHKLLAASLFDSTSPMKLHVRVIPSLFTWGLRFLRNSAPTHYHRATIANFRLARYSLDRTRDIRERLRLQYEATNPGTMKIFRSSDAITRPLAIARLLEPLGLKFKLLNCDEVLALEPALRPIGSHLAGGLFFPDDEAGDAYKFCEAVSDRFRQSGGTLRFQSPVSRIALRNGKVHSIETGESVYPADAVVVAAGSMTSSLMRPLSISLPIRAAKGYTITIDASQLVGRPIMPIVDDALHGALAPLGARLRVAGTAEFAGEDKSLPPARVENLFRLLEAVYPEIARKIDRTRAQLWTGLRPMSADGVPFIGETRISGVYVNSGHGHLGWTLAAGSACLLADLISNRSPAIDPAPYTPTR